LRPKSSNEHSRVDRLATATSLRIVTAHELDRAPLLAEILEQLERSYDRWLSALATSR
jgi:biotin-(acetyl-CoA carboxylase) ligase